MDRNKMEKSCNSWAKELQRAIDFDSWGQPVEASDVYKRISKEINSVSVSSQCLISQKEKNLCNLLIRNLDLRIKSLKTPEEPEDISLDEIKKLIPDIQSLVTGLSNAVLCDRSGVVSSAAIVSENGHIMTQENSEEDSDNETNNYNLGTLNQKPAMETGKSYITVFVSKIGIKEAFSYNSPKIVVSVKDHIGLDLCASQITPISTRVEENYVYFENFVHLQRPLEDLPKGFAIFFEFRHFKVKKSIFSTKCFAFVEREEIKPGQLVIELYKKPTDFRRRNLTLLTTKPLYLHLNFEINGGH